MIRMNSWPRRRADDGSRAAAAVSAAELRLLRDARAEVVARSGWGERFTVYQPRNAAFWVFWVLALGGAWHAATVFGSAARPFASTVVIDGFMLALYAALCWWITHTMDRYSTLPAALAVHAVVWGGLAATFFFAIQANDAVLTLWGKNFGQAFAADWGAGLTAPVTEEFSKGIGLVLLITLASRVIRTTFDAFILGAFIGLGFEVVEDLLYVTQSAGAQFGTDPFRSAFFVLVLRLVTGVAGHLAYSAIFATGLFLLIGSPAQRRRVLPGVGLMLLAMLFHSAWDSVSGILGPFVDWSIVLELGIMAAVGIAVVLVFRFAVRPEKDDMRTVLAPEVATGVITREESDAACSTRHARRRFVRRGVTRQERRARGALLRAVGDLAHAVPDADGTRADRVRHDLERIRGGAAS